MRPKRNEGTIDFSGLAINNVDLSAGELNGANLSGSSLRNGCLVGAQLDGAVFVNCDLTGARFDGANLTVANFIHAEISQASFEGADTEDTIWSEADAEAFHKKESVRFKEIFESRKNWTDADQKAPAKKCAEAAVVSKERYKRRLQEGYKLWCEKRNETPEPQP